MGQKYDDGQKGHDYSGKGPGNGQIMNSSSNKAYRWNNEGNLSFQILHEKKIHPATTWVPKSREKLANLIIITSKTIH